MTVSAKTIFARCAGACFLTAGLTILAAGVEHVISKEDEASFLRNIDAARNNCVYPRYSWSPFNSDMQETLLSVYNEVRSTETGGTIMENLSRNGKKLCFIDPDSDVDVGEGFALLGISDDNEVQLAYDAKSLTSSFWDSKDIWPRTLAHEGRHLEQYQMKFMQDKEGNFLPSELIVREWLREADGRLAAILFAYEKAQVGEKQYLDQLRVSNSYRNMVSAFLDAVENPGGVQEAMRGAIREFRRNKRVANFYDERVLMLLADELERFNPNQPLNTLLTDEALMEIGKMGPYGINYMNDELMNFIRGSFTMDDYNALREKMGLDEKKVQTASLSPYSP